MKVILVYPGITNCGFDSYGKSSMESSWISHGLCSISAFAKKYGYLVELIDLRRLKGWDDFALLVREKEPDVVGMTMMSVDYNPAMECIQIVKRINPNAVVIVGGVHPSVMVEEVKANDNIDYIIMGEGEVSFTELLTRLKKSLPSERVIQGIKPNLDDLPFADRDLFGGLEYPLPIKGFDPPFVTVIAGRGCSYNCRFCQPAERIMFGRKVRRRSVDNIMEELSTLRDKYAFNSWMIHDDCLTEDVSWVQEFVKKYKDNGFTQPFACQSRSDIICRNEELIKMMRESGLRLLLIGFESGNQRVLNFLRKGTKVEHNYKAAEICRKHGIKIWANYMLGIPTETNEEVMDTVKMIRKIKPDVCCPAFFTPHPGSDLFKYCQENNLSLISGHDSYRRNPTEAKIKGIDYAFLNRALKKSMGPTAFLKDNRIINYARPFFDKHPNLKKIAKNFFKYLVPR